MHALLAEENNLADCLREALTVPTSGPSPR